MKIFRWLGIHLFLVHRVNAVSCKPLCLWRQVYLRKGYRDDADLQLIARLCYIFLSLAPFSFVLCTLSGNCAGRIHRAPRLAAWDLCLLPLVTGVHSSWHFCEVFYVSKHKGLMLLLEVTLFWLVFSDLKTCGHIEACGNWRQFPLTTVSLDSKPQNSYSSKPQPFTDFGDWLFHASSLPVIPTSF